MTEQSEERSGALTAEQFLWGSVYGSGIVISLVIYGILQERIMTMPYDGELFTSSVFLVCCNRLAAVVFAVVLATAKKETLWNNAPLWKYAVVSFSNVYASSCQYESLKYVSFAVQMLGKSFKMMPVMLWGMAISGKRYGLKDWLVACAVTGGVTMFLMTGQIDSRTSKGDSIYGLGFLLLFLLLDGLTSTFQEKLFKEHKTSKYNQMFYINLMSAVTSFVTLIGSGTLMPAINFAIKHPVFTNDVFFLSASAVSGQYFIYSQVKEFGALVFAATMNVRQVASILISNIVYGHATTILQALSLFIVFAALFYKSSGGFFSLATAAEKKPLIADVKCLESAPEDSHVAAKV
jgi:solute carrier family 35 (adenosine 3'-phospho 5'-phosphosulfate transporter), member B2